MSFSKQIIFCMITFSVSQAFAEVLSCGTAATEPIGVTSKSWVDRQNAKANSYFKKISSRPELEAAFRKMMEKPATLVQKNLLDGSKILLVDQGLGKPTELILEKTDQRRVLLSSHQEKRNGSTGITSFSLSPDSAHVIVPISKNGSIDLYDLHVIEAETGRRLETLTYVQRDQVTWLSATEFRYYKDGSPRGQFFHHRIGTPQERDSVSETSSFWSVSSEPKSGLILNTDHQNISSIRSFEGGDWAKLGVQAKKLIGVELNQLVVLGEDGGIYTMHYRRDGKRISVGKPHQILPAFPGEVTAHQIQGRTLIVSAAKGEQQVIRLQGLEKGGHALTIPVPRGTSAVNPVLSGDLLTVTLTSPIVRRKQFVFDVQQKKWLQGNPEVEMMRDDQGRKYVSENIHLPSKDGTLIPVRLVRREDVPANRSNPALIEAYGGFGIESSFYPSYSPLNHHFLARGGVVVAPALRGGIAYGKEWHNQGKGTLKQNVFDDFIAVAEYLNSSYSSPQKLAAMGWSNGGLLMGAVVTQRPDLFKVVIVGNGVLNMMKKDQWDPKFGGWSHEYGSSGDPASRDNLMRYSPVHRAEKANYPTVLIVNGLNDSRVNKEHSMDFTRALQDAQQGSAPILLTATKNSGHWITSAPLQDLIGWRTNVRIWSTIFEETGVPSR